MPTSTKSTSYWPHSKSQHKSQVQHQATKDEPTRGTIIMHYTSNNVDFIGAYKELYNQFPCHMWDLYSIQQIKKGPKSNV
jgi:hypothetical protein